MEKNRLKTELEHLKIIKQAETVNEDIKNHVKQYTNVNRHDYDVEITRATRSALISLRKTTDPKIYNVLKLNILINDNKKFARTLFKLCDSFFDETNIINLQNIYNERIYDDAKKWEKITESLCIIYNLKEDIIEAKIEEIFSFDITRNYLIQENDKKIEQIASKHNLETMPTLQKKL